MSDSQNTYVNNVKFEDDHVKNVLIKLIKYALAIVIVVCGGFYLYDTASYNGYKKAMDEFYYPRYNQGYNSGVTDGQKQGYDTGYDKGYDTGYDKGYAVALSEIKDTIYSSKASSSNDKTISNSTSYEHDYVLNTNTGKFHYSWCYSASTIKTKNKAYFTGTRQEVINKGYVPCKNCNP